MATITTRSGKGSPLTNNEVDSNFTNLNTDKVEKSGDSITGNLSFADNAKAVFGAGSDLQIYHDGTNSYVADEGTGVLNLKGEIIRAGLGNQGYFDFLRSTYTPGSNGLRIGVGSANQHEIKSLGNIDLVLERNDDEKLRLTSTGIDVTGEIRADAGSTSLISFLQTTADNSGLAYSDSNQTLILKNDHASGTARLKFLGTASESGSITFGGGVGATSDTFVIRPRVMAGGKAFNISGGGDISFYEDTGTTPKFFWDASTERLGLGTSSPDAELDVRGGLVTDIIARSEQANGIARFIAQNDARSYSFKIHSDDKLHIKDETADANRLTIDTSGNVGIGTSSPSRPLHVVGTGEIARFESTNATSKIAIKDNLASNEISSVNGKLSIEADTAGLISNSRIDFKIDNSEVARFTDTGRLGLGTSSPTTTLHVDGEARFYRSNGSSNVYTFESDHFAAIQITGDMDSSHGGPFYNKLVTSGSNGRLEFRANDVAKMTMTQAGLVGIGTTSPTATLDVDGTIKLDGNYPVGSFNVALGNSALDSLTTGDNSVAIGNSALTAATTAGYNVAVGRNALVATTSGGSNVSIGGTSMTANTTGAQNVAVGRNALLSSVAANNNVGIGFSALQSSTTGHSNVAIGMQSGDAITTAIESTLVGQQTGSGLTTGDYNTAFGYRALFSGQTITKATAIGYRALYSATGGANTAIGYDALRVNTSGGQNTAVGYQSLDANTTGQFGTALGHNSLTANTTGSRNTGLGTNALASNLTGSDNTAVGYDALTSSTSGNNTAVGKDSLKSLTTGNNSTALGHSTLKNSTSGGGNVALGSQAARELTTGATNVAIGRDALVSATTDSNNIAIGYQSLSSLVASAGNNIAIGNDSQRDNVTGNANVSLGVNALRENTTGDRNVAIGHGALLTLDITNSSDSYNVAVGYGAGFAMTTGTGTTVVGGGALDAITTQSKNTALGYTAASAKTAGERGIYVGVQAGRTDNGDDNICIGEETLRSNSAGSDRNIAIGHDALYNHNQAGSNYNIAIGYHAGRALSTGTLNTLIGGLVGDSLTTGTSNTMLGRNTGNALTTGSYSTFLGDTAGAVITTGTKNTIVGRFSGNGGGLDIRTSNNHIVLSDGDGNPRGVFDASGNFLVGKASAGISTAGGEVRADGQVSATRSGDTPVFINRLSSDGRLIDFRKDGNVCGFIESSAGENLRIRFSNDGDQYITGNGASNYLSFSTANGERGRFDNSGKFMVGTSQSNVYNSSSVEGSIIADGHIQVARNGGIAAYFNRNTSDGAIIELRRDGANKGAIGVQNNDLVIHSTGSGHSGLRFGYQYVAPTDETGAIEDAVTSLGDPSYRFKDLYLSGDTYLANASVLKFKDSGGTSRDILTFDSSNNVVYAPAGAGVNNHIWKRNGSEYMRLNTSGNLGVGVSNPDSKLEVNGTVNINGIYHTVATQTFLTASTANDLVSVAFASAQNGVYVKIKYRASKNNSGVVSHVAGEELFIFRSDSTTPAVETTSTNTGSSFLTFTTAQDTANNKLTVKVNPGAAANFADITYTLEVIPRNVGTTPTITHL